ncbi:unnamed protein product [Caenorhabditis bovis]|uniref:Uncharacterized protein n=1 Tax=Caenorhabditis bovis TaxID=2654633 RepID=A0A8S1EZU5_9PELO|nr:unnamed protein product [Caenorhabditis bovis]
MRMLLLHFAIYLILAKFTNSDRTNFAIDVGEMATKAIHIEQIVKASSLLNATTIWLHLDTSNLVSLSLNACHNLTKLFDEASTGSYPLDIAQFATNCSHFLIIQARQLPALGSFEFSLGNDRIPVAYGEDFRVQESHDYLKKVKIQSLNDTVEVSFTTLNDTKKEIFISFCETKPGKLFTSTYSKNFDFSIGAPLIEQCYDEFSCDNSSPSIPISLTPMFIRIKSSSAIGTIHVKVNGQEPPVSGIHANYENKRFKLEHNTSITYVMEYDPKYDQILVDFDVELGPVATTVSPCNTTDDWVSMGMFAAGRSNHLDMNIEQIMANSSCSLLEIEPNKMFVRFLATSGPSWINLWHPSIGITWPLAVLLIVLIILMLFAILFLNLYMATKTGNYPVPRFTRPVVPKN